MLFIEKSRDMMISWLCVGFFIHAAMTNPEREVLFQSQKEDKAAELIDYAKTLYEQQDEQLRRRFPLAKPLKEQSPLKLEFANGSRIIGIPEGADQIRSYHPWGLLMDEAAFQPEAGEAYDAAVPVCQKINLKQSFAEITKEPVFALANPGLEYQVMDVVNPKKRKLPSRRLIFAGRYGHKWFIHYKGAGLAITTPSFFSVPMQGTALSSCGAESGLVEHRI